MKLNKSNAFQRIAAVIAVAALAYMWYYNFAFEPNPEYGGRASTASNVGRDHWAAFIMWGVMLGSALISNILCALKKFNVTQKLPRVFTWLSVPGLAGFLLCKNEKFFRIVWTFSLDQYAGEVSSDYPEHTFVSSTPLFTGFISKKSLHSAFSVIFGVCLAVAIMYFLVVKSRESRKFRIFSALFAGYIALSAFLLRLFLSGTAELAVITGAIIILLIINNTNIMLEPEQPEKRAQRQKEEIKK